MKKNHNLTIGNSVIVKPTFKDKGFGIDMGGWQGRISEIMPEKKLICIDWDSITLKNMPSSYITQCEEKSLGWDKYYLKINNVEPTQARDNKKDVESLVKQFEAKHALDYLFGNQKLRIQQVLDGVDRNDEWKVLKAWNSHLRKALQFPFDAEVSESQEGGLFQAGDKVIAEKITDIDELNSNGIIIQIKHKGITHHFPLFKLKPIDNPYNYAFIQDYLVWFTNR